MDRKLLKGEEDMWELKINISYNEFKFKIKKLSDAVGFIEAVKEAIVLEKETDVVKYSLIYVESEEK